MVHSLNCLNSLSRILSTLSGLDCILKELGLAASERGLEAKGNRSLSSGEKLAGDTKPPKASTLQCPTKSEKGAEARVMPEVMSSLEVGGPGLWRCSHLCLWAGKMLIPAQWTHSLYIHLLTDSHVSRTLCLDEFTVCLFYCIEVARHRLRMRGLEIAAGLRWGEIVPAVERGWHGVKI